MYRRAEPHLYAFDGLGLDGRHVRPLPLIDRKRILRDFVPPQPSPLRYVDHDTGIGVDLYRAACAMDLQAIVAKWAVAPYGSEPPSWLKVKNPVYTQAAGRWERFEARAGRSS